MINCMSYIIYIVIGIDARDCRHAEIIMITWLRKINGAISKLHCYLFIYLFMYLFTLQAQIYLFHYHLVKNISPLTPSNCFS